jgi:HD-GYP domain-containing protein (c-di-GMP phosphodiesterase class II)
MTKKIQNEYFDFLQVPPSQVLARKTSLSDLYVSLPSGKMIKISHKDEPIDINRIERIAQKKIDALYVTKNDFNYVISSLLSDVTKINLASEDKKQIAKQDETELFTKYLQLADSLLTRLKQNSINEQAIEPAARLVQSLSDTFLKSSDLSIALKCVFSLGDDFSRNAMGTMIIANWLAKKLKWKSPRVLQPLSLGAFFHDIGFKDLPPNIYGKNRLEMTKEEIELFNSHPFRGVELLAGMDGISNEVLTIIQQHHELPGGHGFPLGLRGPKIYPLSKVVSFANQLCHEMIDPLFKGRTIIVDEIVQRINVVYQPMYGSELASAAGAIFQKNADKNK